MVTQLQDSGGHRVTGSGVKDITLATANVQDFFRSSCDGGRLQLSTPEVKPHRKCHRSHDQICPPFFAATSIKEQRKKNESVPIFNQTSELLVLVLALATDCVSCELVGFLWW